PLWPSFVPLIHEVVQFAVAGRGGDRQRMVGDALSAQFPATADDVEVLVATPDGVSQSARTAQDEGLIRFTFDATSWSGIYEVSFSHPLSRTELYAVNFDSRESNLAKFAKDEISQELLPGVDYEYDTSWSQRISTAIE